MKDIYIIGASGFGREVAWLIERINANKPEWNIVGFIDDNENLAGKKINGYPIIGKTDYLIDLKQDIWVICAVGASVVRKAIISKFEDCRHIKYATLIDPSVIISSSVEIGEGTIICAGSIITTNVIIGDHVIVNLDCTIGHDDIIHDFATLYPSVNVSGNVTIEPCVEIGTGTQIIQGISIKNHVIIGAGAVVIRDLPCHCTAVGSPAKPIKTN